MMILRTDGTSKFDGINNDIEYRFAHVRIQVAHTLAESLHILSQQLICIGNSIVQVADFVVRKAVQIFLVQKVRQPKNIHLKNL